MGYKEKYEMALEGIQEILDSGEDSINMSRLQLRLQGIFPELKESEDEKIKKEIIQTLKKFAKCVEDGHDAPEAKDFLVKDTEKKIAWLEKQGKQEEPQVYETEDGEVIAYSETDGYKVVEPKFKVGDWILYSGDHYEGVRHITKINENGYYIERNGLPHGIIPFNHEICMRLWTINDAKDGDVLVYHNTATEIIMLFKSWVVDREAAYTHFHIFDNDFRVNNSCDCGNGAHPATKEQSDLLFQKMKEAGYMWDAEKKELKKIEDENYDGEDYGIDSLWHAQRILEKTLGKVDGYQSDDGILEHKCAISAVKKLYEQKPTQEIKPFEAEHGKYYYCIKDYFCGGRKQASKGDVVQALRGLPIMGLKDASEYFLPVNSIKCYSTWSEEDNKIIEEIINDIECARAINYHAPKEGYEFRENWLKSLKDKVQPQPKQEWSEEDEILRLRTIGALETCKIGSPTKCVDEQINWLKSLRPQNVWISVDEEVYVKEPVLAQKKDKSDQFGGFVVCCDHTLTPNIYERYMILDNIVSQNTWKPSDEQMDELENEYLKSIPKY